MNRSREIIEIFRDVVADAAKGCDITVSYPDGSTKSIPCPAINYVFGNTRYIKDRLDELSKTPAGNGIKFPLVALFCPFEEKRDSSRYFSKATVSVLIANSTMQQWSNEERLVRSFRNILRPIYVSLLAALRADGRLDFGYDGAVSHKYSENYSYGRYGAHTSTGEQVSEPIDAINISNLELTVTNQNCR